MPFYVYILKSLKDGTYYKGLTNDPIRRLAEHNTGKSYYTSYKMPWQLVYVEQMPTYFAAERREKNLKKATRERIEYLLVHPKNIVSQFIKE